jgi:transposase
MLRPMPIEPIPPETVRVARAAFPKGNRYLRVADALDTLFTDDAFGALFPTHGQPAFPPWRLALATILQFAEGLSDRQAAEAVRSRIDWKYVLRLELTDPGFDASVLSEFRSRLITGAAESLLFDTLLTWCRERQLVNARGRQRTDSTHVLAAVRALNRIEVVGETMRHALNTLAVVVPAWLRAVSDPEWQGRYARRAEDDRLPTTQAARAALARTIGQDGWRLLAAIDHPDALPWLREVPAVAILRRVWIQNYLWDGTQLQWREADNIPPAARFISSPYDVEAHYARKHTTQWVGYKVHITETCEDDLPHLITNIDTTPGPTADGAATPQIHAALEQRGLLPGTHIVDTGFLDADLLVDSRRDYGVDLLGPTRLDYHWQAREGAGFDAQHFQIDWDQHEASCPAGQTSISWTPAVDNRGNAVIKVKFSSKDCRRCDYVAQCVRSKKRYPRRTLTIRPQPQYQALQTARQREATEAFQAEYARRAGIEGTISRGVRGARLRRTRYVGLPRVHLGHLLTAAGLNVLRLGEWFLETARAKTRATPLARLLAHAPAA